MPWRGFSMSDILPLSGDADPRILIARLTRNDDLKGSPLPDCRTAAQPGTAVKVEVMRERARLGRNLFHPDDLTVEDMRAMGYGFTIGKNGTPIWRKAGREQDLRAAIDAALDRLRRKREEDDGGGSTLRAFHQSSDLSAG